MASNYRGLYDGTKFGAQAKGYIEIPKVATC